LAERRIRCAVAAGSSWEPGKFFGNRFHAANDRYQGGHLAGHQAQACREDRRGLSALNGEAFVELHNLRVLANDIAFSHFNFSNLLYNNELERKQHVADL
jgi:hypothetical protein